MSMNFPDWAPPILQTADGQSINIRHAWCVGRNYAEHAREMGADSASDSNSVEPVFFSKPAAALVQERTIAYPPDTEELHHEVELVAVLGRGGSGLSAAKAGSCVAGYAVGCDLTRRDVQARAKQAGHPWELAKGFDMSGPVGPVSAAADWQPDTDVRIRLWVNDELRQSATLGEMIWPLPELLARLSHHVTLRAGDAVFAGTPAGVGPLRPGDHVRAAVDGLPELIFDIATA